MLLYDVLRSGVINVHFLSGILDGFAPFIHLVDEVFPARLVQLDVASDLLGFETEITILDALFHKSLFLRFSLHLIILQVLAMSFLNIDIVFYLGVSFVSCIFYVDTSLLQLSFLNVTPIFLLNAIFLGNTIFLRLHF